MAQTKFSREVLLLDPEQETKRITSCLRDLMRNQLKRRGLVIGLSGGIDSSVTAALAVRALGASKVFGLEMPERHSAPETLMLSHSVAKAFDIETAHEDISVILDALGCYRRYDDAVRLVIPEYGEGWKSKVVISESTENKGFSLSSVVAQSPDGVLLNKQLSLEAYRGVVAATNFKQRTRKMLEYYHADRLNFAVAGTPNRLEYDQGFFVKLGDGASDVKPIAHLYKSQVYQMAEYLGVPKEICKRAPTTDTYSLAQGQDEFYFSLPYPEMDLCLYAKNNGIEPDHVAEVAELTTEQVQHVFKDIETKRSTTRYLHLPPQLVVNVSEIKPGQTPITNV
jgi:NAD+ synthase